MGRCEQIARRVSSNWEVQKAEMTPANRQEECVERTGSETESTQDIFIQRKKEDQCSGINDMNILYQYIILYGQAINSASGVLSAFVSGRIGHR